jgi:UDP-apiose/xylose synthase
MTKRLVILGCGGFIGSHLLERLLNDADLHIDGWDPDDHKIAHLTGRDNFTLHRETTQQPGAFDEIRRAIIDADVVINLAAICNPAQYNTNPLDVINANFLDVYPVVEACSDAGTWLIHFSTSEVYGRTIASYLPDNDYADPDLYELNEDATPLIMGPIANQRWSYACAKQLMERFLYAHHMERGLPFTIVRPLNFFGPRMDFIPGRDGEGVPRVLACFMTALLDGAPMQLVDGGAARRTIVSIEDAIDAIALMLEKPDRAANQIFIIGNRDNEVTMAELADRMRRIYADITGDASYMNHPIQSVSGAEFYGPGYEDCDRRMPSIDKARELLGWEPKIKLDDALRTTMVHFHELYGAREAAAFTKAKTA